MSSAVGIEAKAISLNTMNINEDEVKVAEALSRVLADTFSLYLKTHNFHWNVKGPMSHTLHLLFEEQYNELWLGSDLIAERISTLGFIAPGSYSEFAKLTYLREVNGTQSAKEMINELVRDHEISARTIRSALSLARRNVDAPTEDLLTQRLAAHEKAAWTLRNLLVEESPDAPVSFSSSEVISEAQ
jgi:starvation-inducible DNA-binding protein